jgi:hypothetical protein
VSRYWLTYHDLAGRLTGVVIRDAPSLALARLQVTSEGLDQGAIFCDGHELDNDSAALIAPDVIGRMLSREETAQLIRPIEHVIQKRPPAASITRRDDVRNRSTG